MSFQSGNQEMGDFMHEIYFKELSTPVGRMLALATGQGLCGLEYCQSARQELWKNRQSRWFPDTKLVSGDHPYLTQCQRWLDAYFHSHWDQLPKVQLDQRGSAFELQVWQSMLKIPRGQTQTYKELAIVLGNPNASRAVGNASRRNPISLIVPCHRVIGTNASLTGYGGGLENKDYLLVHENAVGDELAHKNRSIGIQPISQQNTR
ncbi:MAG: methylated-DNA--[protein]-cysteine S-methyltransferase [Planctomycetota bacterium]